jgi:hypothetical protein
VSRGAALAHDDFGELALVSVIRLEAYLFVRLKRAVGRYAPPLLKPFFPSHKEKEQEFFIYGYIHCSLLV